ncbi:MAG: amidohydrolase family protein [Acidobacteria bacterium]|nr:amidohydrolase family protein [Acidobacteriota bacterium]
MTRRTLLAAALAPATEIPIIDTHIHLFDPTRPKGIPWPPKGDKVRYKTALPPRYIDLTSKLGVVGAIELECSPWLEDNQWVLDVCAPAPIMVLDKLRKNPLYLGIRYGNIWGYDIGKELGKPEFIAGLKELAKNGMILDSANPDKKLLEDLRRASDLVPDLRIMIDHLPGMEEINKADAVLRDLSARKQIYVKVSSVLKIKNTSGKPNSVFYKPVLDEMWQRFGEDRVVFGSDWPNSDGFGTYEQVLTVVKDYVSTKPRAVAEKYFYKNSLAAYRWKPRTAAQKKLV